MLTCVRVTLYCNVYTVLLYCIYCIIITYYGTCVPYACMIWCSCTRMAYVLYKALDSELYSSTRLDHINNCLCFQVHMRNLELLVNLLGKYKLQLLPDCDRKSCHYIAAKSEAFSAKLG